jgi:hypothetical protein
MPMYRLGMKAKREKVSLAQTAVKQIMANRQGVSRMKKQYNFAIKGKITADSKEDADIIINVVTNNLTMSDVEWVVGK